MTRPDAPSPRLPPDGDTVFREPWEAKAFALTIALTDSGVITPAEWAEALGRQIAGDPADDGTRYYQHWLAALEALLRAKAIA